jgi:GTP-binding protein Era
MTQTTKCGFVALLGAPNAGKSTLLNQLTGSKLAIVSPKAQTTRTRVIGVITQDEAQIVFVDLPGVFAPKRKLERAMVQVAWEEARTADQVLVMVDASRKTLDDESKAIVDWLGEQKRKAILVLNKVDATPKERLLALADELFKTGHFTDVLMISAKKNDGVSDLLKMVVKNLPEGPWQYDGDALTDMPERLWASEITREQVFLRLHAELPYAIAVETEAWEEKGKNLIVIHQCIYVQRDSQKGIVLGKNGAQIKEIGSRARAAMEEELEKKIHLELHVKVKENWPEDIGFLREQGLMGDV